MNAAPDSDGSRTRLLKADVLAKTIAALESMKGNALLSGEDSGLRNVWEEICVQVQGEESFYWDTYLDVIDDLLTGFVEELSPQDRLALWLLTDAGYDWLEEAQSDNANGTEPPVWIDQISDYLKSDLMARAADFENTATRRYLSGQDGDDEWEDEDEDEDEEEDEEEEEEEDAIEGDISENSPQLQPTASASKEIEAIWQQAMAEVRAGKLAAPGTDQILDEVYAALDEQGKASLAAALEGLKKIFGARLKSPRTPNSEAAVRLISEQLNLNGFDEKLNVNLSDKTEP